MKFFLCIFLALSIQLFSQSNNCNLIASSFLNNNTISKSSDLKCLAKNASKSNSIFYTFSGSCAGCRDGIDVALDLQNKYDAKLFVILMENETDPRLKSSYDFLKSKNPNINLLLLSDTVYGNSIRKRNSQFISEVTSAKKKSNPGFSIFMVYDEEGNLQRSTDNYVDFQKKKNGEWESNREMVNRVIVPYLVKK